MLNAMLRYNTIDHSFCTAAHQLIELAKGEIYTELLVNECIFGLISYFDDTEKAIQCVWREYAIQDPIYAVKFSDFEQKTSIKAD